MSIETSNGVHQHYENGQLFNEELPDGIRKRYMYDEQGNLNFYQVFDNNRTTKNYRADGTIAYEQLSDGSYKSYYPNGKLQIEQNADGTFKFYNSNGKLYEESFHVGNDQVGFREYYENGNIKSESFPDGSVKNYNLNGQLIRPTVSNASSSFTTTRVSSGLNSASNMSRR